MKKQILKLLPFLIFIFFNDQAAAANVSTLNLKGEELYSESKYEDAKDEFLKALALESNNLRILNNLSITYIKLKDYKNAIINAKKVIILNKNELKNNIPTVSAYYNLGKAYEEMGNYFQAIQYYNYAANKTTAENKRQTINKKIDELKIKINYSEYKNKFSNEKSIPSLNNTEETKFIHLYKSQLIMMNTLLNQNL